VLLKIVYVLTLVRRLLSLAVLVFRGDRAKDADLLALRHENAVLRRHVGRVRYEPADRVWFAALAGLIPRTRWTEVFPVTPATLLAWHRKLAAKKYDTCRQPWTAIRRTVLERCSHVVSDWEGGWPHRVGGHGRLWPVPLQNSPHGL